MTVYDNFTEAYVDILKDVYTRPDFTSSPRGLKIKESLGYQFKITNPRNRIPYVKSRDFSVQYMVAELLWYLNGSDSTEWISNYSSFWSKISDDGKTANSAYGARIFKPHPRIAGDVSNNWTQWSYVVEELKKDPDSRRAVIHIRSPKDSISATLDVPCTLSLQFFLRNDKVHMITSMRSSDAILGLAYDVPAFTLFQELLAVELTHDLGRPIGLGDYVHLSGSLHIYERHFEMVEKIIDEAWKFRAETPLEMPALPAQVPSLELALSETGYRKAKTTNHLLTTLNTSLKQPNVDVDYWADWCKILASHRAVKLGDKKLADTLLSSTTFEGYHYFKK
jgi:thymidylate synthase